MYTIREETYDLVKELVVEGADPATSGTLVPSKLTNTLVWKEDRMPNSVEGMMVDYGISSKYSADLFEHPASSSVSYVGGELSPTGSDLSGSSYSLFSSRSSEVDNQNMKFVWNELIVIKDDQDGCEYCSIERNDSQYYPKHQTYVNGKLCCPVLLAAENSQRAAKRFFGFFKATKQQKKN